MTEELLKAKIGELRVINAHQAESLDRLKGTVDHWQRIAEENQEVAISLADLISGDTSYKTLCHDCEEVKECTFTVDPFDSEINGKDIYRWRCEDCLHASAYEI